MAGCGHTKGLCPWLMKAEEVDNGAIQQGRSGCYLLRASSRAGQAHEMAP